MNFKVVVVGELDTNCYIVENEMECLIIDPGDEFDKIKDSVTKKVVGVLLTHKHFDHYGAMKECCTFYSVHEYSFKNMKEGDNKIGSFDFIVKYNPGHTMDSISFIFNDIMFCGDFVFKGTIGRCDIGGDFYAMQDSIRALLKSKIDYKILPGHGNSTKLSVERRMLESYIK